MTEKPAPSKPTSSRKPSARRRKPDQDEISKRAYFIHVEEGGSDQLTAALRGCVYL